MMKKHLLYMCLSLLNCLCCYGQEATPPTRVIIQQEILSTIKDAESNPTTEETFDKRLRIADAWILLLIKSGRANEIARIAPPDTIPGIFGLKKAGKNDEAYKKLDSLFSEFGKIGLPQMSENIPPPSIGVSHEPSPQESAKDAAKSPQTKQTKEIVVDFKATEGEISPYVFGTTLGPDCDEREKTLLKDAGFKLLMVMLPLNDVQTSFYTIDDVKKDLRVIIDAGATPFFLTGVPGGKPEEEKRYFSQLKNIVTYINNEWVKKYPNRDWIFRFGNEPDFTLFWKGSQADFFKKYAAWAKTIKEINPKFIVGGPGLQFGCMQEGSIGNIIDSSKPSQWATSFLQYVEKMNVPLDFFSFHAYSPHIYLSFNQQTKTLYSELSKHPKISPLFGIPKLANDEWNIITGKPWSGVYNPVFDQAWAAAHNVCALINMIHEGLWLSIRYGGICRVKSNKQAAMSPREGIPFTPGADTSFGKSQHPPGIITQREGDDKGMEDFLLVTKDGIPKPVYYAFKGINQLSRTPVKLKVVGNDRINFAAIAGKSKDNTMVTIVLANYDSAKSQKLIEGPPMVEEEHKQEEYRHILRKLSLSGFDTFGGYKLFFKNVPWSAKDKIVMKRYVVSDRDNLREVENKTLTNVGSNIEVSADIISPSIHVITFEKQNSE